MPNGKGSESNWKYYDIVEYLLSQQFFSRPNYIIDRRAEKKIKVKGSEEVIDKLIAKIKSISKPFDKGEDEEFVNSLASTFRIRAKDIFDQYQNKLDILEEIQKKDKKFKMMVALSVILSYFHKRTMEATNKLLKKEFDDQLSKRQFDKLLECLYQTADVDLSLLQNVAILLKYAQITKTPITTKHFDKKKKKVINKIKSLSEAKEINCK